MSTENLFTNWLPSELLSINAFKRLGEIFKMRRKSWKQVNLQLVLMLIRNLGANIFQRIKLQFTITIYRPRSVHQRSKYLKYLGWPYYKASRPSKILISCLAKLARLFSVCNVCSGGCKNMINYLHWWIQLQADETSTDLWSCRLVTDLLERKDSKL